MSAANAQAHHSRTWLRVGDSFHGSQLVSLLRAYDLAVLALSLVAAVCAATSLRLGELLSAPVSPIKMLTLLCLGAGWWVGASVLKIYDTRSDSRPRLRLRKGTKALLLGLATGLCAFALLEPELMSAELVGTFAAFSSLGLVGRRAFLRLACGPAEQSADQHRCVLVVGTGLRARAIARRIDGAVTLRTRVIGFVDDQWSGMSDFRAAGGTVVSDLKNLGEFLRGHTVDEMVVALPLAEFLKHRTQLLTLARSYGLTVRFPISQLVDPEIRGDGSIQGDLLLSVYHGGREGWLPALKRAMDPVLGFALLAATSPLFLAIAVLIKLDSRGPVFFAQERVGLNRRRFRMYKFRTMVEDAESRLAEIEHLNETGGPTFKLRSDPRITRMGRWLRRTSLDELPQLLNILRGEMSLVGPRPLPPRDVDGFDAIRHQRRFSVLPGLTGLWQVSGRSLLPFETWMELDLRYVDEWSIGLDLWILARTIPAVLSGRGAE